MYQETNTILEYSDCLKQSRESGKNQDYGNALFCLHEADRIKPNQEEVWWGLATTYCFSDMAARNKLSSEGKTDEEITAIMKGTMSMETIDWYDKLRAKFSASPYRYKYCFELGQVYLRGGKAQEGLNLVKEAMEGSDEFNYFLERIGGLYEGSGILDEALIAYQQFDKFFPDRKDIAAKIDSLISRIGEKDEGCNCHD